MSHLKPSNAVPQTELACMGAERLDSTLNSQNPTFLSGKISISLHLQDAQSRLRKLILGLSPQYRTGWTFELCGDAKRAATFPIVSSDTLETLLQRFEQSKQGTSPKTFFFPAASGVFISGH